MNKKTILILIFISTISLFVNLYKKNSSPPCLNADEAAFGYNAYSLLKTGKDEYGTFLPLRLKSFGDYKMPLYSYLSIPFIAIGGLNAYSTKAVNTVVSILFPIIIYLLTKQLFGKNKYGYLSAFLFSLTPAIQTIGRQAHESYLTTFLIILSLWLLLKSIDRQSPSLYKFLFIPSLFPLSFGYQFSRLWLGFFLIIIIFYTVKKKLSTKFLFIYIIVFVLLLIPDIVVKPTRVNNLLFFNNQGLGLQIAELRSEGSNRFFYNKATIGFKNFVFEYFNNFSLQFLVTQGEHNNRFAFSGGFSMITLMEYLFLFVGLYFLFKDRHSSRLLLTFLLLVSPLAASLSWAGASITRSLPLIVFINIVCAYGFIRLSNGLNNKFTLLAIAILYLIFCFYSWDFYYNHYPKRPTTIRSWQCGYKELASYIKKNYSSTDKFYITNKNGQPYIFMLFYLSYPPVKYQKLARLSAPDEFGFGQVKSFDKFDFNFFYTPDTKKTTLIGFPDDFNLSNINKKDVKKIIIGPEEMFWIYSNK